MPGVDQMGAVPPASRDPATGSGNALVARATNVHDEKAMTFADPDAGGGEEGDEHVE